MSIGCGLSTTRLWGMYLFSSNTCHVRTQNDLLFFFLLYKGNKWGPSILSLVLQFIAKCTYSSKESHTCMPWSEFGTFERHPFNRMRWDPKLYKRKFPTGTSWYCWLFDYCCWGLLGHFWCRSSVALGIRLWGTTSFSSNTYNYWKLKTS
jgi:hypothetical protein